LAKKQIANNGTPTGRNYRRAISNSSSQDPYYGLGQQTQMNQSRDSSKDLSLIQKSLAKNFAEHFKNACNQIKNMRTSQQQPEPNEAP